MPNNMEERGLTEREIMQLALELEKGRCRSLSNTLLETEHPGLRQVYQECLNNAYENQKQIFSTLQNEGWYRIPPATIEEIAEVQQNMQNNLHPDQQF